MSKQNKAQNIPKDTISNIKKEEEKKKVEEVHQNEEDYQADSDEENTKVTGVVQEQVSKESVQKKGLKDIFGDKPNQPKPKPQPKKEKKQATQDDEPKLQRFTNSKGTANANVIDSSSKSHNFESQQQKRQYNTKALIDNTAKDNEAIKAPKNYLDKEVQKKYKDEKEENVPKPEFKNLKVSDQDNFIEIKKNEDLFLKNLTSKPLDNKLNYSDPKNQHPKKTKPEYKKEEEPKVELDSDGFEIIVAKSEKKSTGKQNYNKPYNQNKKKYYKKDKEQRNENGQPSEEQKGEINENQNKEDNNINETKKEEVIKAEEAVTITLKAGGKLKDLFK